MVSNVMTCAMIVFLVASSTIASPLYEKFSDVFHVDSDGVRTIIDPTKPMKLGDVEAYWKGYYQPSMGLPVICSLADKEWSRENTTVRFPNGSEPEGLEYGCPSGSVCFLRGCYSGTMLFNIVMYTLFLFGLIFSMCAMLQVIQSAGVIWSIISLEREPTNEKTAPPTYHQLVDY